MLDIFKVRAYFGLKMPKKILIIILSAIFHMTFLNLCYGMDANSKKREYPGDLDEEPESKRRRLDESQIPKSLEEKFKLNTILAKQENHHASHELFSLFEMLLSFANNYIELEKCLKNFNHSAQVLHEKNPLMQQHFQPFNNLSEHHRKSFIDAALCLGKLYQMGWGTKPDTQKAQFWLAKAGNLGNTDAQCLLGSIYSDAQLSQRNLRVALEWFGVAAKQNDAQALNGLCKIFSMLNKDPKPCSNKFFCLGRLYEEGWGVSHDHAKSLEHFKNAAFLGDTQALSLLRERNILDKVNYFSSLPEDIIVIIISLLKEETEQAWYIRPVAKIYCSIFDRLVQSLSPNMSIINVQELDKFSGLCFRFRSLKILNLEGSNWSNFKLPFKSTENFLENCASLTSINLRKIIMSDEEDASSFICCLAQQLSTSNNLTTINLSNNRIFKIYYTTFYLAQNTNLTDLDLSGNIIAYTELEYITNLLNKNSSLTKLNLSRNGFAEYPEELEFNLLTTLVSNTNLKDFDFSNNIIYEEESFIQSLSTNTTLIRLNIYNCTHDGYQNCAFDAIADLWKKNETLEELHIDCTDYYENYMHEVMKTLAFTEYVYYEDEDDERIIINRNKHS
jgi:hypothetical protein